MSERLLTLRELNRATLARQVLLERKRLSPKMNGDVAQPFLVDGFVAGMWRASGSYDRGQVLRSRKSASGVLLEIKT